MAKPENNETPKRLTATAEAPAGVGNVAVGFDILGHALTGAADRVTARVVETENDRPDVKIAELTGCAPDLPLTVADNCAGLAAQALLDAVGWPFSIEIELHKGIPLCSGMGGSAASSVAATVAVNALLPRPLKPAELIPFAIAGERLAAGAAHADNIAPSILGGLILMLNGQPVRLPVPEGLHCVLVHPAWQVSTRLARERLLPLYPIDDIVQQTSALAGFLEALHSGDFDLLAHSLTDHIAEPRRADLVPGFTDVKKAALVNGALGSSLSGSGPSVFAWCRDEAEAIRCGTAMERAFRLSVGLASSVYVSPVDAPGAQLINLA